MTTATPIAVKYVYFASPLLDAGHPLHVESIRPSADQDQLNWSSVTIRLASITDDQFEQLDPRNGAIVSWQIDQYDEDDNLIASLPYGLTGSTMANSWVRAISRDYMGGGATLRLAGPESMLDDRKRLSLSAFDTGAATVAELIDYALYDTFGGTATDYEHVVETTSIPAGDRRWHNPGETFYDVLRPELDAIGSRLYSYWGREWRAGPRNAPTGRTTRLSAYPGVSNADPIVYEVTEILSRDGDWADGVMIKYDTTSTLGATGTVTFERYPAGANTKGLMLTYNRAAPGGNSARDMQSRTVTRGYDLLVVARPRLDVLPGDALEVVLRDRTLRGNIRSVEWDFDAHQMTIRAQHGNPI